MKSKRPTKKGGGAKVIPLFPKDAENRKKLEAIVNKILRKISKLVASRPTPEAVREVEEEVLRQTNPSLVALVIVIFQQTLDRAGIKS